MARTCFCFSVSSRTACSIAFSLSRFNICTCHRRSLVFCHVTRRYLAGTGYQARDRTHRYGRLYRTEGSVLPPVLRRPATPALCSMSLRGHHTTPINASDSSDLFFNPFVNASQSSFSSALKKTTMVEGSGSIGTRLAFRRRGSESSATRISGNDGDVWQSDSDSGAHARSMTADAVVGSSSSTRFHPLQTPSRRAVGSSSSRSSITDTRPRLKRLLSDLGPDTNGNNDSENEREDSPRRNAALREKVVIIHEVSLQECLNRPLFMIRWFLFR
jgi:hypothetical protein